jgi:hypothetical protein
MRTPLERIVVGSLAAVAVLVMVGVAVWTQVRPAADGAMADATGLPSAGAQPPAPDVAQSGTAAPAPAQRGAGMHAQAAMAAASQPLLPPVETPSESLRKVQRALGGGSPEEALSAGLSLLSCRHADQVANSAYQARDLAPLVPSEIRKKLDALGGVTTEQIERAQQEQRRCQVFDAAQLERTGELLRRAYEGGARVAPQAYLSWLQGDGKGEATPALIATLQAQVIASAEAGDITAIASAAYGSASDLGATPVQAQAYREAWLRIGEALNPGSAASTKNVFALMDQFRQVQPLTAEQQREVDTLVQKIVDAWHDRRRKGGG